MSAQIGIGLTALITAQNVFDTIWRDPISEVDLKSVLTYLLCLALPFGALFTIGMYSRFSIWLGWVRDSSDADEV